MPQATGTTEAARRPDNLALLFQEVLAAIVRLRSSRQAPADAESFRQYLREGLDTADDEARRAGYSAEDIEMARFAVVGFLDESVLDLSNPLFAGWSQMPLQAELFGTHMAGEVFFQRLRHLLARGDSQDLADVLEVYYLCLRLGFRGRYSVGGATELHALALGIAERLRRIRGQRPGLSPAWVPPPEPAEVQKDPWIRRLLIGAIAFFFLAMVLFGIFNLSLGSGFSEIQGIATRSRS